MIGFLLLFALAGVATLLAVVIAVLAIRLHDDWKQGPQ